MSTPPSLIDPAVLIDPYPAFAWLRENDPIHWSHETQSWIVTRHVDIISALRNPDLSADRAKVLAYHILQGGDTTPVKDFLRVNSNMMLNKDGQNHHRLRILGNRGFTPSAIAKWTPKVHKVIGDLLERVAEKDRFDLVADLAEPMPASIIASMFGIPESDHTKFRTWADDMARFFGGTIRDPLSDAKAANDAANSLEAYFLNLYETRRKEPGDDLMSLFLSGEEAGKLTAEEVVAQCMLILIAGHVTTIDQLSNGVYALLRIEGNWQRLVDNKNQIPAAVDEMIRFDSSVTMVMRVAAKNTTIGDRTIHAGQLVMLALASANRDPTVFENPARFDMERTTNKQIGFGAGPHLCLGMNLARIELEASLQALVERFPNLELDPEKHPIRKCESLTFRGFTRLPLRINR